MKYNEMFNYLMFLKTTQGENSPSWNKAINDLEIMMEFMGAYEKPNNDKYPTINEKNYKKIEEMFDNAVKSVDNYLKENENSQDDRIKLFRNFNNEFLAKAYVEYKNVKPNPEVSLHDAMNNFRYENVTLSNNDLKHLGANLSSRIELSVDINGQKTKGVFTPITTFDPKKRYQEMLNELKFKYPMYNSFWDSLNNDHFYNIGVLGLQSMMLVDPETRMAMDQSDDSILRTLDNFERMSLINGNQAIDNEYVKYKTDPAFYGAIFDLTSQLEQFVTYRGMNVELGIEVGKNIDVRNCAMSSVATILGVDDLIAKAKQITVKMTDGKFQSGTFMEFVNGKDVMNLNSVDEMKTLTIDDYDTVSLKTQLANLQVLDYICGNIDRHVGNMFYDVDPETRKVVGIKGIDNDASFISVKNKREDEQVGHACSIKDMRVIDEEMAKRVLEIDEGILTATLHGYGLTDKEVKASWERLKGLQNAIKGAETYNPEKGLPKFDYKAPAKNGLIIVKKDDWDKLPITQIQVRGGRSLFDTMTIANDIAHKQLSATNECKRKAEVSRCSLKSMLDPKNTKAMIEHAKSNQPFMGTSERYKNVINALKAYQNTPAPDDLLSKANDPKWIALDNLKVAVDAYKEEKIRLGHLNQEGKPIQNFKGKPLNRIHDVEMIGKFADKVIEQRKMAIQTKKDLDKAIKKDQKTIEFNNKSLEEKNQILKDKYLEEQVNDLSFKILKDIGEDNNKMIVNDQNEINNNIIQDEKEIGIE